MTAKKTVHQPIDNSETPPQSGLQEEGLSIARNIVEELTKNRETLPQSDLQEEGLSIAKNTVEELTKNRETLPQSDLQEKDLSIARNTAEQLTENSKTLPQSGWQGRGFLITMGIGLLVGLGGTGLLVSARKNSNPDINPTTSEATPAQSVTVAEVQTTTVNQTLKASGTVVPFEEILVFSQATGLQIREILVDEGAWVKAGQVLARLDDTRLQAQLMQAQAAVAGSEARLAELRAGTRPTEIAKARENVRVAEAGVAQAESEQILVDKRVQQNQMLATEGAITLDRLDELLNQQRVNRSNLAQAKARLAEAQKDLEQLKAGPRIEAIAQAEAQLAGDKAQVQLVMAQLQETKVLAPRSGKIVERNAKVGDINSTNQPLFKISENGRLELRLDVPQTELYLIKPGQKVKITSFPNADNSLPEGKVRDIKGSISLDSRQAKIRVDLPPDNFLKPGMFLSAEIVTSASKGLTVPFKAVLPQKDGGAIVYSLEADNTVRSQPVEIGAILPGQIVEITRGLSESDRVVVKGAPFLKEGDKVEIINR